MWFYFALTTAVLSGFSVALAKKTLKNVSPVVLYWATFAISTPIIFLFIWNDPIPSLNKYFFIGILASAIPYTFSKILFYKVIKDSELSHVYPLIALSPVITILFASLPPLNEKLTLFAIIGSGISIFGSYILNISSMREGIFEPFKILLRNKSSLLMLFIVFVSGVVSVFDKFAINNTMPKSSIFTILAENILVVLIMMPYVLKNRQTFVREISTNKMPLFILGALFGIGGAFVFLAIGGGNVGVVNVILRSQVLFTLLFSFWFFKDKPRGETIFGTIIMIAGLIILKLGI